MNKSEQPINQILEMEERENEKLPDITNQADVSQSVSTTQNSVSQITDDGSVDLGKFKDVQSLVKAYNSLQTEFTKKSQRLSELENAKTEFSREEKINQALTRLEQNHNIAYKYSQDIRRELKDVETDNYLQSAKEYLLNKLATDFKTAEEYMADEQFVQQYIYNNQAIKDNIIREYLTNLTNATPIKVVSNISSSIPVSPPNVPATIQEAGKLAKNIIKKV